MMFSGWAVVVFFMGLLGVSFAFGWEYWSTRNVTLYFIGFITVYIAGMVAIDAWYKHKERK